MTANGDVGTLIDLFGRSVQRHAQRPAVSDGRTTLSFLELDRRSDAAAALVRSHGVQTEDRVGVYLSRSVDLVVAVLGILKAGAAYIAVDDRYPGSRRDHMLRRGGVKLILVEAGWADRLTGVAGATVPVGDCSKFEGQLAAPPPLPENVASVLFTSGSSGQPKGILLEHRNLVSFATNPSLPRLRPEDRTGQVSSVSFDAFHFELWCTLAAGAEMVVLPAVTELLAADFQRQMRKHRITAMLVPTMMVNHVVSEDRDAFAPLRILGTGGDVLLPSACRALLNGRFSGQLYNLYGPTEITTACTAHRVTSADVNSETIPIGTELAGTTVRLLDSELRQVRTAERGEIFVGGPGLARGYLDRPDLDEERFLTVTVDGSPTRMYRTGDLGRRREDGRLLFIGRMDGQVKIRGYRVEPGEVEQSLMRYPDVQDVAVLADGEGDDRRLVAVVVLSGELTVTQLRGHAERDLPDFMVPSQFIVQERIPFNEHGKRDREALLETLAQHKARAEAFVEPQSLTERYLVSLWEELLSVERVGRDDDFFALGGHSLLAFRMSHRINRELGIRLEFATVLDTPLLKDLAAELDVARNRAAERRAST